ncbi:MAG: hypothetical protein JST54_13140 [Deltaproteobacteria bacterium]|nr:hypothetical protein [Deltaproteobacteria bacterium]
MNRALLVLAFAGVLAACSGSSGSSSSTSSSTSGSTGTSGSGSTTSSGSTTGSGSTASSTTGTSGSSGSTGGTSCDVEASGGETQSMTHDCIISASGTCIGGLFSFGADQGNFTGWTTTLQGHFNANPDVGSYTESDFASGSLGLALFDPSDAAHPYELVPGTFSMSITSSTLTGGCTYTIHGSFTGTVQKAGASNVTLNGTF